MRFVKALAVIIPLLAATLALVFTVRPSLKPCVGASGAEFTGAPVFPHVRFRDHLHRSGASQAEMRSEPNILGAEVRFSYKTDDLRGAKLPIRWTLLSVEKDGTLGAVDRTQDRALAKLVTPDGCSRQVARTSSSRSRTAGNGTAWFSRCTGAAISRIGSRSRIRRSSAARRSIFAVPLAAWVRRGDTGVSHPAPRRAA